MIDLSVVIPTYNAKRPARATVELLSAKLAGENLRAEILLVDDGSRAEEQPDPASIPPRTRVIQLDRNRGKGYAVREGLRSATGRVRIFTDVDLPYGVDSIMECYERLSRGDVALVYGDRSLPDSKILSRLRKRRRLSSVLFRGAVFTIVGLPQPDTQCGIKGMRGSVASSILPLLTIDGFAFDVEIFRCALDNGLSTAPQPVHLANGDDSTVRLVRDSTAMLRDLITIRARSLLGKYRLGDEDMVGAAAVEKA